MGDNDFTAGDPWGLPIEDSEEIEIESAWPEPEGFEADVDVETGPDEDIEPDVPFAAEAPVESPTDTPSMKPRMPSVDPEKMRSKLRNGCPLLKSPGPSKPKKNRRR